MTLWWVRHNLVTASQFFFKRRITYGRASEQLGICADMACGFDHIGMQRTITWFDVNLGIV